MAISLFAPNTPFADLIDRTAQSFDTARNAPAPASPTAPQMKSVFTQPAMDMSAILTADPYARQQVAAEPSKLGFQSLDQAAQANSFTPQKLTGANSTPTPVGSSGGMPAFGYGPTGDASIAAKMGWTPAPGMPGDAASLGGDWSGVDQWNSAIQAASAQTGVDPNLIKAVMKLESNGDPNAAGASGVWGPMQVNANAWGWGPWMTDPVANILKGAQILKGNLDQYGGDVTMALRAYHGFGSDGYTTDQQYASIVMGNYQQLQQAGYGRNGAGGTAGSLASITGNPNAPITQGFGMTDFAANSAYAKTAYAYTADYSPTHQVIGHAGIDIGLNPGSNLFAPVGGTVEMAGGSGYYCDADEGRCGPGAGELMIRLDNGDVLILGHMRSIGVQVGQRVAPGQMVGLSGSENGGHVHVEYRKWVGTGVTTSGYQVIDPQQVFGGGYTPASGGFSGVPGGGANLSGIQRSPLYDFLHRQGQ